MRAVNPRFIPRNHLVEATLVAAAEREDFRPFEELLAVLTRPYRDDPDLIRYATPARDEERVLQTFCGT
jgi:serine/tyrosine/threonine adenylyltransferase